MIPSKHSSKNKNHSSVDLKLPQINSKKQIKILKKNFLFVPQLPHANHNKQKKNMSNNKENKPFNPGERQNILGHQIKHRFIEIQAIEKAVKNLFGNSLTPAIQDEGTIGFLSKIEANREILRKKRNKSLLTSNHFNLQQDKKCSDLQENSLNSIPSQDNSKLLSNKDSIYLRLKLKIHQNVQLQSQSKNFVNENKMRLKSDRKPKKTQIYPEENAKVFKSIKKILSDPQKNFSESEFRNVKFSKFTIQELEKRLKKMKSSLINVERIEDKQKSQNQKHERNLIETKSMGKIPFTNPPLFEDCTIKQWNRVDFSSERLQNGKDLGLSKVVKLYKSSFDQEIDHIKHLQMKSHKQIEKMIQNKKLLIDLKLLNIKNKICVQNQDKEVKDKRT